MSDKIMSIGSQFFDRRNYSIFQKYSQNNISIRHMYRIQIYETHYPRTFEFSEKYRKT